MVDKELIRLDTLKKAFKAGNFTDKVKEIDKEIKKYQSDSTNARKKSESETHERYEKMIKDSLAKKAAKKTATDAIKKKNQEINRAEKIKAKAKK
jgi:hypothetical protein